MTVASSEIILQHAKTQKNVVFAGLENWFSSDNNYNKNFAGNLPVQLLDTVVDIIEAAFQSQVKIFKKILEII